MTLVELLQQAASESDTPNTSIEGKAANLIERQAAQIEMMREALEKCGTDLSLTYKQIMNICTKALSTTPDQALEQFAAKVREQCQMTCLDKHANGNWKYDTREECAEAIRTIKELP